MRLDSKVHGKLIKDKDGKEIPEDEFVVFRAHDKALIPALRNYAFWCAYYGASVIQLLAVDLLIKRVSEWQIAHPDRCKVADIDEGECIEPVESKNG